ncbi:MAG: hypothetical protein ABI863_07945 [Ginsengibacter sp.]
MNERCGMYDALKMLAILAYCVIILNEGIISSTFIFYLLSHFLSILEALQVCAILAFIGLISAVTLTRRQKIKGILFFEMIVLVRVVLQFRMDNTFANIAFQLYHFSSLMEI